MKTNFNFFLVAVFAIFLGTQIAEGALLVPYWQSMKSEEFFVYYQTFGPSIGHFFTVLTIIAAIVPICLTIHYYRSNAPGLTYATISTLLALVVIAFFYLYFKGANELFYTASLNEAELKNALVRWKQVHWIRVFVEGLCLLFLILALSKNKDLS